MVKEREKEGWRERKREITRERERVRQRRKKYINAVKEREKE
jgi:hypothetical protein